MNTKSYIGKTFAVAVTGLSILAGQHAFATDLPKHPCTPELNHVLTAWNATGLQNVQMPSKPGAMVRDAQGHAYSAAGAAYINYQIRQAVRDCQDGKVASVQKRVASLEGALDLKG